MKKDFYLSPEIEIMEITIEKGFATSPGAPISDWAPDNF